MSQNVNINIRMDEKLKKQAEELFADLGMNMTTAINVFVRQSVNYGGIPFEIVRRDGFYNTYNQNILQRSIKQFENELTHHKPLAFEDLSPEAFNNEIEKGFNDLRAGRVVSADKVAERITKEYGHEL